MTNHEHDMYVKMIESVDLYMCDQNIPPSVKRANLQLFGEHVCSLADSFMAAHERQTRAAELLRAADQRGGDESHKRVIFMFSENSQMSRNELEKIGYTFREIDLEDGTTVVFSFPPPSIGG